MHLLQLRSAGIGASSVVRRVRAGRLHMVLPSVYLVGRPVSGPLGRMMAAALYLKGDGLVCGPAAAQLWSMLDVTEVLRDDEEVDALVVGRGARARPGVRLHRTGSLAREDIGRCQGIPVTAPARTLLDCAATLEPLGLETVLAAALRKRLVSRSQLREVIQRAPRGKGAGALRALLELPGGLRDTRSLYERRLLELLSEADLPLPDTNVQVAGMMVDAHWPQLGLVLEFDGWMYHSGRTQFEKDRLRDQRLAVAGQRVLRVTAYQIDHRPYALIARLVSVIAATSRGSRV
ncbi:MAG: hypothetical protein ACP5H2_00935 [Solirubrobacteraceae bacterium]